ncbi:MAG: hypothetical protein H6814_11610 [Phycisphaeraceae bacterium]|nr:hypothetical protein [Phycisphaeraceae bacterium]
MPPAALLRHTTPDGRSHYDWLLATDLKPHNPDDRVLTCFRIAEGDDPRTPERVFEAERLTTHRWLYLTYEGELSEGRGRVERLASGGWAHRTWTPGTIDGWIEWDDGPHLYFCGRAHLIHEPELRISRQWSFRNSDAISR